MPPSLKTAKEILEKSNHDFLEYIHSYGGLTDVSFLDELINDAMHAAVEAVDITGMNHGDDAPHCNCLEYHFKANVSRFFNDDPTSPPTPPN